MNHSVTVRELAGRAEEGRCGVPVQRKAGAAPSSPGSAAVDETWLLRLFTKALEPVGGAEGWEGVVARECAETMDKARKIGVNGILGRMHNVLNQAYGAGKSAADDRMWCVQGLAFTALALTEVAARDTEPPKSVTHMQSDLGMLTVAFGAISETYRLYADACEENPGLFARPLFAEDSFPPAVVARRREATTKEAAAMGAPFVAQLRLASAAALEAAKTSMPLWIDDAFMDVGEQFVLERTGLYRWFDAEGRLLYVGISADMWARQGSHARKSTFIEFAVGSTIEWFDSRAEAEAAELEAIGKEKPLFNVVGADRVAAQEAVVNYLIDKDRTDLLRPDISRG